MEYAAVCHYADQRFCFALEKGKFLFRIKTKRGDVRRVVLLYQDKYLPLAVRDTRAAAEMTLAASDTVSDYFEAVLTFQMVCLRYYFLLEGADGTRIYYGNYTFQREPFTDIERMFDCPQNLREEEMLQPPAWAAGKVVYQVFPTRFAADPPADEALWYKAPIRWEKLGGSLRGLLGRLDHLQALGVDVLYLTPVFLSDTEHKYDTIDYYQVDPSLGSLEDLRAVVAQAHARGMRVILDGVFNHTSTKFFAFADILEKQEQSAYLDWYFIKEFPLRMERGQMPNFKTFGYFGRMPKLNLRNPAVEAYFLQVGAYWVRECGIDGWRLDVADEVGHRFWRRFREAIRAEKPDALLVGEEWHYGGDFLQGDQWDTVMNYPFCNAVTDLAARGTITVSEFIGQLGFLRGNYHPAVWRMLWNLVDSHDTPRFLHSAGDRARQRLAAALQLLLPGMPMLYYGDEFAMEGGPDPDCRRGMVWDEARQDRGMFAWYQRLIRLRHAHPCLAQGEITPLLADDASHLLILSLTTQPAANSQDSHRPPAPAPSEAPLAGTGETLVDTGEALTGGEKILADAGKALTGSDKALPCSATGPTDGGQALADGEKILADTGEALTGGDKTLPCSATGPTDGGQALADGEKILADSGETLIAVFHCGAGEVPLPRYAGRPDLLQDAAPFPGTLPPWSASLFPLAEDEEKQR